VSAHTVGNAKKRRLYQNRILIGFTHQSFVRS